MINRLTNNNISSTRVFSLKDVKSEYLSLTNKIKRVFNISNEQIDKVKPKLKQGAMQGKPAGKRNSSLREQIKTSYVMPDSGHIAKNNFIKTERFNGIKNEVTTEERKILNNEKNSLMKGNVSSLLGKGIMSAQKLENNLPIKCEYTRLDKENNRYASASLKPQTGIEFSTGNNIKAAEIILGKPLGNYFNKQNYDDSLKVVTIDNGNCGTIGISFNLNDIKADQPLLLHSGQLSGCTMAYAIKGEQMYAFHAGKPGNDDSDWKTDKDGVKSMINGYEKMAQLPLSSLNDVNNQSLIDYFHDNFDFSAVTFCGHGENVTSQSNVIMLDYNKPSEMVNDNNARVANAVAVISKEGNTIKIETLLDDMVIDKKTLETHSINSALSNSQYISKF